jgi:hypothetical protein
VSVVNTITRNTGICVSWSKIEEMTEDQISKLLGEGLIGMAPRASLEVIKSLDQQITKIEKTAKAQARLRREYELLKTVWGVGTILGLTIMYETGEINRFAVEKRDSPLMANRLADELEIRGRSIAPRLGKRHRG